ncbi:hypothetical protein CHUAL_013805 [Chamberlinius hualienensis]
MEIRGQIPENFVDGMFYIQKKDSDLVLDINPATKCSGSKVVLAPFEDSPSQYWEWYNDGLLRNVLNGYVIDSRDGGNGVPLVLWPVHGKESQKWHYTDSRNEIRDFHGWCMRAENAKGAEVTTDLFCKDFENTKFEIVTKEEDVEER